MDSSENSNGLEERLSVWRENEKKFEDVIEQLKQEFGLAEFRPYLGPDATPENVLEEGRKILTQIMNGDFVSEPPVCDVPKRNFAEVHELYPEIKKIDIDILS